MLHVESKTHYFCGTILQIRSIHLSLFDIHIIHIAL
jgi:hypothetical protein